MNKTIGPAIRGLLRVGTQLNSRSTLADFQVGRAVKSYRLAAASPAAWLAQRRETRVSMTELVMAAAWSRREL